MKTFMVSLLTSSILAQLSSEEIHSTLDEQREGLELAQSMRDQVLEQNVTGILIIGSSAGGQNTIPLTVRTDAIEGGWKITYRAEDQVQGRSETLIIQQVAGSQPRYFLEQRFRTLTGEFKRQERTFQEHQTMASFAGTDFWIADLGRDFLYWPRQRVLRDYKRKMRRGQACRVLESINPHGSDQGYCRVLSWIERQHNGLVLAEFYDSAGKKIKEFRPKVFKKVDGRMVPRELLMLNKGENSRTSLLLDVKAE